MDDSLVYENHEPLDGSLEWESIDDAREFIYSYALRNGFVALTTSTTKDKRHCILSCNRRGLCKSRSKGFRSRRSQKCGCKWHVNIWIRQDTGSSIRKYRITSAYLKHNHPPLTPEEIREITSKRRRSQFPFSQLDSDTTTPEHGTASTMSENPLNSAASHELKHLQVNSQANSSTMSHMNTVNMDSNSNLGMDMPNDLQQCLNQLLLQAQQVDKSTQDDILLQVQLLIRHTARSIELQRFSLVTRDVVSETASSGHSHGLSSSSTSNIGGVLGIDGESPSQHDEDDETSHLQNAYIDTSEMNSLNSNKNSMHLGYAL